MLNHHKAHWIKISRWSFKGLVGGMDCIHFHGSTMLCTTLWNTSLWKGHKVMQSKELFQWFVNLMCFHTNNQWIMCLKEKGGWWVVGSWYFSLCSGFIPMSVIEDVYSRTLLTCSDSLESASCPSVAPPTSIFWKLAEETDHLCKKVVLMLWLMWLKKVFIPTVEPFYIFCCPSYLDLSILHIT